MSIKLQENKARILPFNKKIDTESDQTISEVTRNLFSDAWRSYLDQTSMAAIKIDEAANPTEEKVIVEKPKLTII